MLRGSGHPLSASPLKIDRQGDLGRTGEAPNLVWLLRRHSEEIATVWADAVKQLPDESPYRKLSLLELRYSVTEALEVICRCLIAGSWDLLDRYLEGVCTTRMRQAFDIGEIIEGMLIWREITVPFVWRLYPPGSHEAQESAGLLDASLRRMIARMGRLYAEAMHRDVEEQQKRTALVLRVVQTAGSSLQLDEVLHSVARGMVTAVGVHYCVIYLTDQKGGGLIPRAAAGVQPCLGMDLFRGSRLDSSRDPLIREMLDSKEPVLCEDVVTDPRVTQQMAPVTGTRSLLAVPISVGGRVLGAAIIGRLEEGQGFSAQEIELAQGVGNAVALAIENARLYGETRRRLAESHSLQRVAKALLERTRPEDVLKVVCGESRRLAGAPGSAIFLLNDTKWLTLVCSSGAVSPKSEVVQIESSAVGRVVRDGEALISNGPCGGTESPDWAILPSSLLAVPLRMKGVVIGSLAVVDKPGGFSGEDLRSVNSFVTQAAITIENARLQQQVEELAAIEERQRLARELHDSLTQSLFSVSLYAEATADLLAAGSQREAEDQLRELREAARDALRELRLLIFELHPPVLAKDGLVAALQNRLDAVEARGGLEVKLQVEGDRRLPGVVEEELYRIVQEALNNVLKHSKARLVTVSLRQGADRVFLEVADDGVGFCLDEAHRKGGMGLLGMRERARKLAATLKIESTPGAGTVVRVEVPIDEHQGPDR